MLCNNPTWALNLFSWVIVRKGILPINSKSLWTAVNIAKDVGTPEIPNNMYFESVPVSENNVADCFADFFDCKVKKLVESVTIDQNVYNGARKLVIQNADFITRDR